ncbi:MAG TPA: zinc ribbon domain-containing protein [Caldilineae bacterium]|nr:zinc ribbon domain-containing protein [Caldilineae bacterium]
MPMYEYYCTECQATFEMLRPFSQADEPVECPSCHGVTTQRLISRFAAISQDGGGTRMIAGSSNGCSACSSHACSTCGVR